MQRWEHCDFRGGADIAGTLKTDTIGEWTAAAGVTVDGVLLKDAAVNTDTINEKTAAAGVTVDGVLLKDAAVNTDTINEKTAAAGVTVDGVLLKDGIASVTKLKLGSIAICEGAGAPVGNLGGLLTEASAVYFRRDPADADTVIYYTTNTGGAWTAGKLAT